MAMAVSDTSTNKTTKTKKEYNYGDIKLSLENCILPSEMLDETPSMKDGLDRDTENDLRIFGCEMIQIAGLLLKLPQVAMATGQVILQRFYYIKSMIKHDMEVSAMAAIFLAAKIEECPRRLRDIINVCDHIKQKMLKKPETPMDYFDTRYFNLKNNVIKAERRILKELGFCVHIKHPHKVIITYLQILEHEKNVALARTAWNYMNDSLRTDVFVRFYPDIIACACIFLAARTVKINLPMKPPWWNLFDASYDDIEDISLSILRLYSRKRTKITHLEAIVKKLKKEKKINLDKDNTNTPTSAGSFTPTHNTIPMQNSTSHNAVNNIPKPSSKATSPEKQPEKRSTLNSVINKKPNNDNSYDHKRRSHKAGSHHSSDDYSSDDSSDSETELPSRKYEKQREQYETNKKRRSPSSDSDADHQIVAAKTHHSISPSDDYRKSKYRDHRDKLKDYRSEKESNGKYNSDKGNDNYNKSRRSRSRSPARRGRSASPHRKGKYPNEKNKDKGQSKARYGDKYSKVWR